MEAGRGRARPSSGVFNLSCGAIGMASFMWPFSPTIVIRFEAVKPDMDPSAGVISHHLPFISEQGAKGKAYSWGFILIQSNSL